MVDRFVHIINDLVLINREFLLCYIKHTYIVIIITVFLRHFIMCICV